MNIPGLVLYIALIVLAIVWVSKDMENRRGVSKRMFWVWVFLLLIFSWGWGLTGLLFIIIIYLFWSRIMH